VLSTFFKRVACTIRSMSEYERVFGGMLYFSANHTNSRSIKLKVTGSQPLPYRKNVLYLQDRCIMEWILVRRRVTRRIIRIKICTSVMELKTWWKWRLYFIYRNRIETAPKLKMTSIQQSIVNLRVFFYRHRRSTNLLSILSILNT